MIRTFIKKIITIGVFPDTSALEIRRIKLTNGILTLMGVYSVFLGILMAVLEYLVYKIITQTVVIGGLVFLAGIIAFSFIILNKLRWYLIVRYSILIIFCFIIVGLSYLYGKGARVDQYLLVTLLLPFGFFSTNKQIVPSVLLSGMFYFIVNIIYQYQDPIIPADLLQDRIWYIINTFMVLVAIVSIVIFFKKQNEIHEAALSIEIERHKHTTLQLDKSNKAKDKFFSVVSHDLKGPIGNISQLFNNFNHDNIPENLYCHIRDSVNNTYSMLEDLLMWSRCQKKHLEIKPVNFDVKALLYKMMKFFEIQSGSKNIKIEVDVSKESYYGFADLTTITIVIRNLISNSIKFTPSGGRIILSLRKEGRNIIVSVSDTGVGVSSDKVEGLFHIGSNTSTQGTEKEKGTGLGLILCKEFVESNNGKIWVKSKLGKGSVFAFTIPEGIEVDIEDIILKIRTKNISSLVVEDDYLDLETTTNSLNEVGVSFDISGNGKDAIDKATVNLYDIIFLDINLPIYNGIYVNKKIRETFPNAYIVALTSYAKQEIFEIDADVNFDCFLRKPIVKEDLLLCLSNKFL